jgi:hypothetical protein
MTWGTWLRMAKQDYIDAVTRQYEQWRRESGLEDE